MSKIDTLDELELYVFLLEDEYEKVFTDYNELVLLLKKDFNIDTTEEQISKLYEPTLEEEIEDNKITMRNLGYD